MGTTSSKEPSIESLYDYLYSFCEGNGDFEFLDFDTCKRLVNILIIKQKKFVVLSKIVKHANTKTSNGIKLLNYIIDTHQELNADKRPSKIDYKKTNYIFHYQDA